MRKTVLARERWSGEIVLLVVEVVSHHRLRQRSDTSGTSMEDRVER